MRGWWGFVRSVVALLAVSGVLAMHGLALHGSATAAPSASAVVMGEPATSSPHTSTHAGTQHDHHPSAPPLSQDQTMLAASASGNGGHLHHGMHDAMAAMCLAVLLLALALLLPAGRRGLLVGLDARRPPRFVPPSLRVARDPPDLHALSILRC